MNEGLLAGKGNLEFDFNRKFHNSLGNTKFTLHQFQCCAAIKKEIRIVKLKMRST